MYYVPLPQSTSLLKVIARFTSLYPKVLQYLFPQTKGVLLHHPSTVTKFSRFNIDTILLFIFFGHATWLVESGILVPPPGIEPVPPAVEAQNPNNWAAREFPTHGLLSQQVFLSLVMGRKSPPFENIVLIKTEKKEKNQIKELK